MGVLFGPAVSAPNWLLMRPEVDGLFEPLGKTVRTKDESFAGSGLLDRRRQRLAQRLYGRRQGLGFAHQHPGQRADVAGEIHLDLLHLVRLQRLAVLDRQGVRVTGGRAFAPRNATALVGYRIHLVHAAVLVFVLAQVLKQAGRVVSNAREHVVVRARNQHLVALGEVHHTLGHV
jgi:hypothetical protein